MVLQCGRLFFDIVSKGKGNMQSLISIVYEDILMKFGIVGDGGLFFVIVEIIDGRFINVNGFVIFICMIGVLILNFDDSVEDVLFEQFVEICDWLFYMLSFGDVKVYKLCIKDMCVFVCCYLEKWVVELSFVEL